MSDAETLKNLIEEIEHQRRRRQIYQYALALSAAVIVIGIATIAGPSFISTPSPVAEDVKKSAFDDVPLSATAAIVYDLTTGEVLYEKNGEAQLPLASLTKLLTLYAASGALSPDTPVIMSERALAAEGDNGFIVGDAFTFEDAAKMALVASSNDAAAAIAEAAAAAFHASNGTALLASAAASLGLSQTYALNGTGLDENGRISGAYGSAHDIAVLAGEFLKRAPDIARASLSPNISVSSRAGLSYTLKNTNQDIDRIPGLKLSKTGFTDLAGGNLAIVFDAGINHPIAVVVMGSTRDERFLDVQMLVKATLQEFSGLSL